MSNVIKVLGECSLGVYDIGCGFQSTIHASSLGDAFERQKCCMCIDAFLSYRRHVFLDLFFKQWDKDKYLNLGTMLYKNYKQALNIISTESIALDEVKQSLNIQKGDLKTWHQEEIEYFAHLGKENKWDVHVMAYSYSSDMAAMRKLETQSNRWQPSSPEYQATMKYMSNHQYQRALDNLQCLVVQHLFELQQLNISQTGMCLSNNSLFYSR
ncbi:hypothetical protein BDR04DRAFT_1128092 [Suillus decipiens]|nr:hypothetical protein BDR04DRAFT_1128092 [Suillus decipiens]